MRALQLHMRSYFAQAALLRKPRAHLPRDLVRRAFKEYQTRTAVICGDSRLSYAELESRTFRLCEAWKSLGIKSGDRIFTTLPDGFEQVETRLAALEMGLVLASFHELTPADELLESVRLVRPSLFIYNPRTAGVLSERLALEFGTLQRIPTGKTGRYEMLISTSRPNRSQAAIRPSDAAELVMTGGVSGHPKGVLLSNAALTAAWRNSGQEMPKPDSPREVVFSTLPLCGIGGRITLSSILAGSELVLPHLQDTEQVQATIRKYRITKLITAPGHIIDLLDFPRLDVSEFATLKRIVCMGSPMPAAKLEEALRRFGPRFEQAYTISELSAPPAILTRQEHVLGRDPVPHSILKSCGRPIPGTAACILTEKGRTVAPGEVGEVLIASSDMMFRGYWPHPSLAGTAVQDGWFRTGDMGCLDSQGRIHVFGPRVDVIVRNGREIHPRFLEEAMHCHPAIREACAVQVASEGSVILCVTLRHTWAGRKTAELESEFSDFLTARVQQWQTPDEFRIFDALPRSRTGALQRSALRQILASKSRLSLASGQ